MTSSELLERLHAIDRESRCLERAAALLRWDQETYLPEKGVQERAEQLAMLEGIAHERLASPETGRLLDALGSTPENARGDGNLPELERDFLKVLRRDYGRAAALPGDFVREAARAEGLSQAAWVNARRDNDFPAFLPHLEKMIDLSRRRAFYWGYKDNPYDGLLDVYESGMGAEEVSAVFTPLAGRLKGLLKKISGRPRNENSFLDGEFDIEGQARFSGDLLKRLGFDTSRGRLDVSAHPFTTTLGSDDIRITTRYLKRQVQSGIFSTVHEAGHAFYEMGFPRELRLSSLAEGASMGIHESQSRLWENVIARGRAFWEAMYPVLRSCFPGALDGHTAEDFYRAVNTVEPSLIRIEADEVTYSLHIVLRFELERELIQGSLEAAKLPEAWREKMGELLGLRPETDAQGALQDVHWSMGAFGYFPSYALGNLYGLQFWEKLVSDVPEAEAQIARGNFAPVQNWLRETIYVWGQRKEPSDLLKTVTGKSLSAEPFLNYVESKYAGIYGF